MSQVNSTFLQEIAPVKNQKQTLNIDNTAGRRTIQFNQDSRTILFSFEKLIGIPAKVIKSNTFDESCLIKKFLASGVKREKRELSFEETYALKPYNFGVHFLDLAF